MPVVINSVEVTQEPAPPSRGSSTESASAAQLTSGKPDPDELRRQLERMADRLLRIQAH